MSNPNGRRGSQFETDLVGLLRQRGKEAERLIRTGRNDQGDVSVRTSSGLWVFEAKARKQFDISGALAEAEVEAGNYASQRGLREPPHFAAVIKAPRKSTGRAYVCMYLDSWIEAM